MKCWICGAVADSREHMIKKSDLKLRFSNISQKKPVYSKRNNKKQRPAGGIDADQFKYKKTICKKCNNDRTKNFDKAWEKLSTYILINEQAIKQNNQVSLSDIFSSNYSNDMILVQLFFAKIFGCKIAEYNIPINLNKLAKNIRYKRECPDLYILLTYSGKKNNYVANSDIIIDKRKIYAHMYYTIGYLTIHMIYTKDKIFIKSTNALKPNQMSNILNINNSMVRYEKHMGQSLKINFFRTKTSSDKRSMIRKLNS